MRKLKKILEDLEFGQMTNEDALEAIVKLVSKDRIKVFTQIVSQIMSILAYGVVFFIGAWYIVNILLRLN